ncbi:tetratricopeptide repeat protein [Flavobacterium sp. 20NA77.7]|uniref:Tetratricopeptide repeat protein n=1 Tax=Flavobacterium nakdongensis TaxID=3073563 RepID=A0ABY9R960_9FLAO|nr:tetratricopeptide repeat protein [Flavobacterium sp. 20NA77.7]WMW77782.1 tetratricopeptide repeat protein [Flavobacterium sp. 20NA77.7]
MEMYENPDKVIATGLKIIQLSGNNTDLKIRAYKLISDGYSSKRNYQKSLKFLIKALELLPKSENKLLKISIDTKAGIQYHQLNIYESAITYLDRAEKMCLEYPIPDSVNSFLGVNYIVRGFIYKEKLNCDIAISFFDKGIKELSLNNKALENASRISIAKYNKGNCYILNGQNKLAEQSFKEALYFAKKVNAKSLEAFALKGIAQIYKLYGKYEAAITELNHAYRIANKVNDLVLNEEIYKGLSENYLALNNTEKYQSYQLKLIQTQTKLKENERASIENLLAENYTNLENKSNSEFSNFWLIFFVASGVIVALVFLFLSNKINKSIQILEVKIKQINSNFLK